MESGWPTWPQTAVVCQDRGKQIPPGERNAMEPVMHRLLALFGLLLLAALLLPATEAAGPPSRERILFDFETPGELDAWSNLTLPGPGEKEPPVTLERVA